MERMTQSLVALGANLAFEDLGLEATILAAFGALSTEGFTVVARSNLYETPCFPVGAGPNYINAAAVVTLRHNVSAQDILARLHRIEARFGRQRLVRWGQRTLDIDLIAQEQTVLPDRAGFLHWHDLPPARQSSEAPDEVILPHPRMQDRAFVLVPLAEVAPTWRHPVLGKTVAEMLADLPLAARDEVVLRRTVALG